MTTIKDFIGENTEEVFLNFDLTEIQEVLATLAENSVHDISHAELLAQKALRGADIVSEYLCKIIKTVNYLETKVNSTKNKVSLEYMASEGRTTSEMKKWAGESAPEVEILQIRLSQAKASKALLDRKYDILIKTHHQMKDVATGLRRTILGYSSNEPIPAGYE
jgi:hypothetical protein